MIIGKFRSSPNSPNSPRGPTRTPVVAARAPILAVATTAAAPVARQSVQLVPDGDYVELARPWEDLSSDEFIVKAPRMEIEGRCVPSLGGIPLFCKLGQGGMGAVYYGIDPDTLKDVAVKVLPFHLVQTSPDMVKRFFREAQIAGKIVSQHLVHTSSVAQHKALTFMTMEYVHGNTCSDLIDLVRRGGASGMDESMALDIAVAACKGLADAHRENVVHRDIKPDNILVPRDLITREFDFGHAKVSDLGLARCNDTHSTVTASQSWLGTPGYMAPEQIDDARHVGKQADVFAMGAALYAMLTGYAPFVGATTMEILKATAGMPHVSLRLRRKDLSKPVIETVDICLAKDPAHRYADAGALLKALQACRRILDNPQAEDYAQISQPLLDQERAKIAEVPAQTAVQAPAPKRRAVSSIPYMKIAALIAIGAAIGLGVYGFTSPQERKLREATELTADKLDAQEIGDADLKPKEDYELKLLELKNAAAKAEAQHAGN